MVKYTDQPAVNYFLLCYIYNKLILPCSTFTESLILSELRDMLINPYFMVCGSDHFC